MNHLAEAKAYAQHANYVDSEAQLNALLAIAHVGIAIVERMDEAAKRAELEAERTESARAYQVSRDLY